MIAVDKTKIPQHVAIIMDGNGRWAKQKNLDRHQGHIEGVKRAEEIVGVASQMGIKVLTLYTFSMENWNRPVTEVSMLMNVLTTVLLSKIKKLNEANIKFSTIGRTDRVPAVVLDALNRASRETQNNSGMILNLAFNYGSRQEILDAVKRLINDGCDIVGMTGMPEAALARELELEYACIALVVNKAAGLEEGMITFVDMEKVMLSGIVQIKALIAAYIA